MSINDKFIRVSDRVYCKGIALQIFYKKRGRHCKIIKKALVECKILFHLFVCSQHLFPHSDKFYVDDDDTMANRSFVVICKWENQIIKGLSPFLHSVEAFFVVSRSYLMSIKVFHCQRSWSTSVVWFGIEISKIQTNGDAKFKSEEKYWNCPFFC